MLRSFLPQGADSASVSFLAQIITQVWRWLEDVVRWGLEVWSGDPVPWKGQIFERKLNGLPYWDWTCFWVHEMDNMTFGSRSTRNWKDIVLHPKYLPVCVASPCPRLEECWIHSSFLAHCWQWLKATPWWLFGSLHEIEWMSTKITTLLSLMTVRFVFNSLSALALLCWGLCHQRKKRRKQQVWLWKCKCDNEESLAD